MPVARQTPGEAGVSGWTRSTRGSAGAFAVRSGAREAFVGLPVAPEAQGLQAAADLTPLALVNRGAPIAAIP